MLCITRVIGSDPSLVDSCLAGEPLLALPVKHGSTLYLLILGKPFKIRGKSTLITKNAWYALRLWPFDFHWIARYNSRWGTKELYEFVCLWTTLFGPYWGNMDKGAGEDHKPVQTIIKERTRPCNISKYGPFKQVEKSSYIMRCFKHPADNSMRRCDPFTVQRASVQIKLKFQSPSWAF